MAQRIRVVAFVDGFNLYHAIHDLNFVDGRRLDHRQYLKWLDLAGLARAFVRPSREDLLGIWYFSAYAKWLPDAHQRHRAYVGALRATGVNVVLGNFKRKRRACRRCRATWDGHEEKESDVNLAITLVQLAYEDAFDKALLMTADTDLVPAVRLIVDSFPEKQVVAVIPQQRYRTAMELRQTCHQSIRIRDHHLERNLLPRQIRDSSGRIFVRPSKYDPPSP